MPDETTTQPAPSPAAPTELAVIAVATIYVTEKPGVADKDGKPVRAPVRRAVPRGSALMLPTEEAVRLLARGLVRPA